MARYHHSLLRGGPGIHWPHSGTKTTHLDQLKHWVHGTFWRVGYNNESSPTRTHLPAWEKQRHHTHFFGKLTFKHLLMGVEKQNKTRMINPVKLINVQMPNGFVCCWFVICYRQNETNNSGSNSLALLTTFTKVFLVSIKLQWLNKADQTRSVKIPILHRHEEEKGKQVKGGEDTDVEEYVLCSVFPLCFPFMNFDVMTLECRGQWGCFVRSDQRHQARFLT